MRKGLYILNYHNISWEDHQLTKGIGGIFSPDVFWDHLDTLNNHFKLVSVETGLQNLASGRIQEPQMALWFDDGQPGARKEALPAMETFGIKGAMSVNSRFMLRQEFHWRFKLSFLAQVDGLRFLRSELRKLKVDVLKPIKEVSIDQFSLDVLAAIDRVFNKFATDVLQDDMYRLFEDVEGIRQLADAGWMITNHSAGHYPVSEDVYIDGFHDQFMECEEALQAHLGILSDYWVLPFDRKEYRSNRLIETFHASRKLTQRDLKLVMVGNKVNMRPEADHTIHRITVPLERGKGLIKYLSRLS